MSLEKHKIKTYPPHDVWPVEDNSFDDYLAYFDLDEEPFLRQFLASLESKNPPVIIDLMASTTAIRSLCGGRLKPKQIKGLAVSLFDKRSSSVQEDEQKLGITHLTGDLIKSTTWNQIQDWLGNQKAHLIIEHGIAGLNYLPHRLNYYRAVLNRMWDMLDPEGGLLYLQTPSLSELKNLYNIPAQLWLERLEEAGVLRKFDPVGVCGILMITKNHSDQALPIV